MLYIFRLEAIQQNPIKVFYKGSIVEDYVTDMIVEDTIIIELKSLENLTRI
ncbi:MAG: GxxExxY protein [Candidatus Jettenia sp. CY-1]|nr:MAG: GxxExxY protein [Candidatus Jettenia sp. CY-1]